MTMEVLNEDLRSALDNNDTGVAYNEIEEVIHEITGENDGAAWHWLVRLVDGRFAYITGWCDRTGWDCRSSAEAFVESTMAGAMAQVPEHERNVLVLS